MAQQATSKAPARGLRAQIQVAGEPGVKELVLARASSKLGIAVLSYGGMVYLARQGASDIAVVMVSASGYIAALLFALQGGTLADILPKRWALAVGLGLQALLCFITPSLFGTGVFALIALLFVISAISQVTTPAMKSAVTLVTTMADVVAVSALIGLIGAIGSAVGSTFLAPLIIRYSGIQAVMYVTGAVLAIAAFRSLKLPPDSGLVRDKEQNLFKDAIVTPKRLATWAAGMPGVASMVLVGALVVALFESINSLLPVYVRDVLHADPALSIYIFAPAGVGFFLGTTLTPLMIRLLGERRVAAISFAFIATGAVLLGSVHEVAPAIAAYSPLRVVEPFGVNLSQAILAAGVIVIPTNFGSTMAAGTVQAFINKYVPLERQGRTFGMQEVLEQAVTITALLSLGAVSTLMGAQVVFLVAPLIVVMLGVWFIRFSYRAVGEQPPMRGRAMQTLVTGSGLGDPEMLMEGQDSVLTQYENPELAKPRHLMPVSRPAEPRVPAKRAARPPAKDTVGSRLMTRSSAPAPRPAKVPKSAPAKPQRATPPAPSTRAEPTNVLAKTAALPRKRPAQTERSGLLMQKSTKVDAARSQKRAQHSVPSKAKPRVAPDQPRTREVTVQPPERKSGAKPSVHPPRRRPTQAEEAGE
jgi:MFS family permease